MRMAQVGTDVNICLSDIFRCIDYIADLLMTLVTEFGFMIGHFSVELVALYGMWTVTSIDIPSIDTSVLVTGRSNFSILHIYAFKNITSNNMV